MSDTFKRIVPSEVPAVCEELGIQPWRGTWFQRESGSGVVLKHGKTSLACALGIQAVAAVGIDRVHDAIEANKNDLEGYKDVCSVLVGLLDGFTDPYLKGLSDGWETTAYYRCEFRNVGQANDEYETGTDDGLAARDACAEAGLTPRR